MYKPKSIRKYGYYVLPVLYGDSFIARFEPERLQKNHGFGIKNWWWEDGVKINDQVKEEIIQCLEKFAVFLGTGFQKESIPW